MLTKQRQNGCGSAPSAQLRLVRISCERAPDFLRRGRRAQRSICDRLLGACDVTSSAQCQMVKGRPRSQPAHHCTIREACTASSDACTNERQLLEHSKRVKQGDCQRRIAMRAWRLQAFAAALQCAPASARRRHNLRRTLRSAPAKLRARVHGFMATDVSQKSADVGAGRAARAHATVSGFDTVRWSCGQEHHYFDEESTWQSASGAARARSVSGCEQTVCGIPSMVPSDSAQ